MPWRPCPLVLGLVLRGVVTKHCTARHCVFCSSHHHRAVHPPSAHSRCVKLHPLLPEPTQMMMHNSRYVLSKIKKKRAAGTADRAPQHRSKLAREFLRNNKDVKMIYLPKDSPYPNAMEECWHQGKRVLLVSEYYKTFQDMRRAVSLYYRTVRFNPDLLKFTGRKYETLCTNF